MQPSVGLTAISALKFRIFLSAEFSIMYFFASSEKGKKTLIIRQDEVPEQDRIDIYCHCPCATKLWVRHTNCAGIKHK